MVIPSGRSRRSFGVGKNSDQMGSKISFGGIPNSSSTDILLPYAIFDYMGAFLRSGFAHVDNVIIPVIKTITWLLLSRLQGNKPHRNSPEPSGTCLRNLHQQNTGTLRNLPEPASGTYTSKTPEPSGTFRNLPPEPAPATCTVTHRSLSGLKTPLAYAVGEQAFEMKRCQKIRRMQSIPASFRERFSSASRELAELCFKNLDKTIDNDWTQIVSKTNIAI